MPKHVDLYLETLKNAGYRITEQRQQICHYLATTTKHPTPYEVYADLSAAHPEISRATVYNTLNTLQSLGAIVEISFGANHTHYDTNPAPHINRICLRCHAVEDYHPANTVPHCASDQALAHALDKAFGEHHHQPALGELAKDELFQQTVTALGFQPMATKIDVLGLCRRCQQSTQQEI